MILFATALSIAGCSSDGNAEEIGPQGRQNSETPDFSGPWADYFRSAYSAATTDLQREVLSDEKITEQENNEVRTAFVSCMAAFDIHVELQEKDSIKSVAPSSMTDAKYNEISNDCRADTSGQISGLYYQMGRNPDNRDEFAIMAECLAKSGLAEPGYSAQDYEAGFKEQKYSFDAEDSRFRSCSLDPLNLEGSAP
ncbi:hypothetical protein [Paenarthrobacter aurescens]|uniref:hypothetical protein n=1 Tax=Paenarthrobacter aurescens TaxID=43663 RepID=UPI0021BE3226|nr:hypothetical protein [Paenarthrobacter aurescens]MCT9870474.1 hypothetical protein [Paenarthrobacter aurescens]